ncbi:unnamed protein product [Peronospora farinosa]|uniref:Uncharacterized protein n=1 Tax=Peronospora farinosa TaxID=134698 RepID=A0AAV0SP48_9STRA|nr:unnamed protein product [Peronospora farinosa]
MLQTLYYRWVLLVLLIALIKARTNVANASVCTACGYLAKNCSDSSASDGVSVCDSKKNIQIDDVFCNDDECQCADHHKCVSTVVGCSHIFQARNRRRCLGNVTLSRRFKKCAIDQDLTTLAASNVASDWIYFKQRNKCQSMDCLAVRMFHQSGLVQCGHLLAVWKTNLSSYETSEIVTLSGMKADMMYYFIADGSRALDMKAGTFLYSVPWSSETLSLVTKQTNSTGIHSCYVLQTRNQPNGTCEGLYLQFDSSVQFANSEEYVMSTLSWQVWLAVVASVAAAIAAIVIMGVVMYRFHHMEMLTVETGEDGGLLGELESLRDGGGTSPITPASLQPQSPASGEGLLRTDLRQRGSPDATQMEAKAGWTAL